MQHWLTHATVFTGSEWINNCHVCVEDDHIAALTTSLPATHIEQHHCQNHLIVPAFIDAQVYGGGGRLFAQFPDTESLLALAAENRKGGTAQCLLTIATQPIEIILECLAALNDYLQQGGEGILGLHLEGPFMHPDKRGAHVLEWIHTPTVDEIDLILSHAKGHLKMITLAPECCSNAVLQRLRNAGVVIAAGHSNATYDEAKQFSARGVQSVTHLFNAMSSIHHRKPGMPVAVFEDNDLMASIIPDGIHVDYAMIKLAKTLMGERLFFITDAVTTTTDGPYKHMLHADHYALPDGTLSGSSLSMLQAVRNGITQVGLTPAESLRMASLYPAKLLGIENEFGNIAPGKKAAMVLLDENWKLLKVFGF